MVHGVPRTALPADTFNRLERQLILICGACSEDQLLDLADDLHEMIRERRERRLAPPEELWM